ncbi:group 1 glycosyl transferase [Pseudomonas knackmussii B13]|uniref:Group 1 glycosyl transferase n=1 Tax=Pseudomonas knackmussii (strain DSM 6978 / CCUG 54928 / LMG 23759 / B13) TaxID=1301098 RepID=A0A024HP14_PSEKB|nr:glycosyltransferase family 1 protein [Pseudomonas knackmussii]CDF86805.1 group 1 glycosyl transferase [Pseudomonas knackmussii B13]
MRIGFSTTVWASSVRNRQFDGIGVYTQALWRCLQEQADAPSLLPYAFGNEFPDMPCGRPERLAGRFSLSALQGALLNRSLRASLAIGENVDLFHATDHHIPYLSGTPVVATVMDLIPMLHPEWVTSRIRGLKNWIFRESILSAEHIITISEYSKQDMVRHLNIDPANISVTTLGADPSYFQRIAPEVRDEVVRGHGLQPGFFLFIGTLQPRKNLERALRAHRSLPPALRKKHPLVVVGRNGWGVDHLLPELEALEQRGEGRWLKYLPQSEVLALLQSAQALLFPSLYEGFGLPVVEAFAAQTPVICSNSSSLPEVAGDAALLVDPLDEQDIARGMQELLADPDMTMQRVQRGHQRALEFTWAACAEQTLAVYRKVLATRST